MTDVISLLTFPDTSKAFTAYRSTVIDVDDRSASHPRKTPRLDADSDSASASRSRDKGKNVDRGGPVKIQVHGFTGLHFMLISGCGAHRRILGVVGGVVGSALNRAYDNLFARLSRSIRALLEKGSDELSTTYEGIYTACRGVVCIAGRGEGLYEMLKVEIHKCVNRLAEELEKTNKEGVEWIGQFVETCAWFEGQVVSVIQRVWGFVGLLIHGSTSRHSWNRSLPTWTVLMCSRILVFLLFSNFSFMKDISMY